MKIKKRWIFLSIVLIFIFLVTDVSYVYIAEDSHSIDYFGSTLKPNLNKSKFKEIITFITS